MANSADTDQKPTDQDLHCLQRQDLSWFSRTRVIISGAMKTEYFPIAPDKSEYQVTIFLISPGKCMLWVLISEVLLMSITTSVFREK